MIEKPDKVQPALFGGLTIAIISSVPGLSLINCFCCAGVMLGGYLAVYFYNKKLADFDGARLESSDALTLGLMSGAFGAIIGTLFSSLIGTNIQQQLQRMLDYSDELPTEMQDALVQLSQYQEGVTLLIVSLILSLIIYSIFAIIGAFIGVSLMNKQKAG